MPDECETLLARPHCAGGVAQIFKLPPIDDVVLDSDVAYQFHAGIQAKAISVYMTSVNAFLCWLKLVRACGARSGGNVAASDHSLDTRCR